MPSWSDFGVTVPTFFFGHTYCVAPPTMAYPTFVVDLKGLLDQLLFHGSSGLKIWGTNPGVFADTTCKTCLPHFIHFVWKGFTYNNLCTHTPCWSETSNLYFILSRFWAKTDIFIQHRTSIAIISIFFKKLRRCFGHVKPRSFWKMNMRLLRQWI